jgi:hypothetical protein
LQKSRDQLGPICRVGPTRSSLQMASYAQLQQTARQNLDTTPPYDPVSRPGTEFPRPRGSGTASKPIFRCSGLFESRAEGVVGSLRLGPNRVANPLDLGAAELRALPGRSIRSRTSKGGISLLKWRCRTTANPQCIALVQSLRRSVDDRSFVESWRWQQHSRRCPRPI